MRTTLPPERLSESRRLQAPHSHDSGMEDNRPSASAQASILHAIRQQSGQRKEIVQGRFIEANSLNPAPAAVLGPVIQGKFWELSGDEYIWHEEVPDSSKYERIEGAEKWYSDKLLYLRIFGNKKYPVYKKKKTPTQKKWRKTTLLPKPTTEITVPPSSKRSETVPESKPIVSPTVGKTSMTEIEITPIHPLTSKKTLTDAMIIDTRKKAKSIKEWIQILSNAYGDTYKIPNKSELHPYWEVEPSSVKTKTRVSETSSIPSSSPSSPQPPPKLSGMSPVDDFKQLYELYIEIGGKKKEGQLRTVCSQWEEGKAGGHFVDKTGKKI